MSRNNIWLHLTIAFSLVLVALLAGNVRKWYRERKPVAVSRPGAVSEPAAPDREDTDSDSESDGAEVLVRFRTGVGQDAIANIVGPLNDPVEDRIEGVDGLDVIEDQDGEDAESV